MNNHVKLEIPKDAFSDGQIRSKLWLAHNLEAWSQKYFDLALNYTLTWYGSWVGLGPFLLLSLTRIKFTVVNLIEVDEESLNVSKKILDHWMVQGVQINLIKADMNNYLPELITNNAELFINTACEHVTHDKWLQNIPTGSFILLQSTNMKHIEHINLANSLEDFDAQIKPFFRVFEKNEILFSYPDKCFSRFMLFGKK
ncbi:MAG: hypothetical protein WA160_03055 [Pseudobdellovibrio sp.]